LSVTAVKLLKVGDDNGQGRRPGSRLGTGLWTGRTILGRRPVWPLIVAGSVAALTLFAAWPGIPTYDTVAQFREVLTGSYDDWHPPAMARWWAVLHGIFGGTTGPMLLQQVGLCWLGIGLIATALARRSANGAAAAVLACGALPVFWVWQIAVLKDAQMLGAALAAVGVVAWWRLDGRAVPWWGWVLAAGLLAYATLVRANAVFAIAPLAAILTTRGWRTRIAVTVAIVLVALAGMQFVNHRLFGAVDTGVRTTQPRFDLAGIAVRIDDPAATRLDAAQVDALRTGRCVKAFFWDPLAGGACADAEEPLQGLSVGELYTTLANAAFRHPIAYAAQRLAHLNSTDRWIVPVGWLEAWPAATAEPNDLGLTDPGPVAVDVVRSTAPLRETPIAWPIAYIVIAVAAIATAFQRPADPRRDLALALLMSALTLEASFAAISIASDLRYHLWPMLATLLSVVLLADRPPPRRTTMVGMIALASVLGIGLGARLTLPPGPASYRAMLEG
jgi:hypothetical protein